MAVTVVVMTGPGIGIEENVVAGATGMIVGCQDVTRGAMTTTDHQEGTKTSLKVAWTVNEEEVVVVEEDEDLLEATETSLQCRWGVGRRAQALPRRRRSLHLT